MTSREEEIKEALGNTFDTELWDYETDSSYCSYRAGFSAGVDWADSRPKSPWINAEDDLPYNHEELISTQDKATKKVIAIDKYDGAMVDFMKKAKSGVWYWKRSVNVLYWMPIPELPKD